MQINLVPKLLFGNALSRNSCFMNRPFRDPNPKRSFEECVPKQEFGNEANMEVLLRWCEPCGDQLLFAL